MRFVYALRHNTKLRDTATVAERTHALHSATQLIDADHIVTDVTTDTATADTTADAAADTADTTDDAAADADVAADATTDDVAAAGSAVFGGSRRC
jgi:hypothetical protein